MTLHYITHNTVQSPNSIDLVTVLNHICNYLGYQASIIQCYALYSHGATKLKSL